MNHPIHHIIDNLYLGFCDALIKEKILKDRSIKHIINCAKEIKYSHIDYNNLRLNLDDYDTEENFKQAFQKSLCFIDKISKSENIFIHCVAGYNRSPSIMVSILCINYNFTVDNAINFIQSKRDIMPSFKQFMINIYDEYLFKDIQSLLN